MGLLDSAPERATISVMGLGSVLMGDDALGPFVIRHLTAAYDFDPSVSLLDLGTPGLQLSPNLRGQRALIIIDAVLSDGVPGSLRLYRKEELLRHPPPDRLSLHDPGLKELLLEFHDESPAEVLVIGVIPGATEYGIGLSEPVRHAVPRVLAAVLLELSRLGVPARPAAECSEPDIWWEEPQRST